MHTIRPHLLLPLQGGGREGDGGGEVASKFNSLPHPHPSPPLEGEGTSRAPSTWKVAQARFGIGERDRFIAGIPPGKNQKQTKQGRYTGHVKYADNQAQSQQTGNAGDQIRRLVISRHKGPEKSPEYPAQPSKKAKQAENSGLDQNFKIKIVDMPRKKIRMRAWKPACFPRLKPRIPQQVSISGGQNQTG